MKKSICVIMAIITLIVCTLPVFGADVSKIKVYESKFVKMNGPEVKGLSVDYVAFSPKTETGKKYPVVLYFHGKGQGKEPGSQITENNFPLWASDELQAKFNNGGAYLLAFRSHEENNECWEDQYIESVKAAADEFIEKNKDYIDLSRIYAGGFSMGGKMTLKMITSYPGFIAASFPMCPAYFPTEEQYKAVADMPIWLFTSKYDVIAGYHSTGKVVWENICNYTNCPADCRFTLFGKVCYPDGKKTPSNHHVWFAVSNDMFSYDGGKYPNAETTDANNNEVNLVYPEGVISWLNRYTSNYDGTNDGFTDLAKSNNEGTFNLGLGILKSIPLAIFDTIMAIIDKIIK